MIDPFIIRVTEHDGYLFAQINPRLEFRTKEIVGVQTKVLDYEGPLFHSQLGIHGRTYCTDTQSYNQLFEK